MSNPVRDRPVPRAMAPRAAARRRAVVLVSGLLAVLLAAGLALVASQVGRQPPRDASDPAWITSALAAELRAGSCPVADPATTPDPAQPRVAASLTTGELQMVGNFTQAAAEDLACSVQP